MSCAEVQTYGIWFETGPESELTVFKLFLLMQMHMSCMADLHVRKKFGLLDLLHIHEGFCISCNIKCLVHEPMKFPVPSWILRSPHLFF